MRDYQQQVVIEERRERKRVYVRKYQKEHKKEINEKARRSRAKIKKEVLMYYGGGRAVCVRCGFADIRALSIDHINGGGTQHIRELQLNGQWFYTWLRKEGYPKGYQTLCMNCQFVKKHGGA